MIRSQIFALLLTVSLFCACAPSLRTTAVRSREQRDIREMAIRQEFSTRDSLFFRALCEELLRRLDSERVRNRIIGQEIETITREYDTNRPVDTLTGKPPLRRETTQRQRLTDSICEASRVQQTEHRIRADTAFGGEHTRQQIRETGDISRQETAETSVDTQRQRGFAWWGYALCIIGLLAVGYGSYKLFKHR